MLVYQSKNIIKLPNCQEILLNENEDDNINLISVKGGYIIYILNFNKLIIKSANGIYSTFKEFEFNIKSISVNLYNIITIAHENYILIFDLCLKQLDKIIINSFDTKPIISYLNLNENTLSFFKNEELIFIDCKNKIIFSPLNIRFYNKIIGWIGDEILLLKTNSKGVCLFNSKTYKIKQFCLCDVINSVFIYIDKIYLVVNINTIKVLDINFIELNSFQINQIGEINDVCVINPYELFFTSKNKLYYYNISTNFFSNIAEEKNNIDKLLSFN